MLSERGVSTPGRLRHRLMLETPLPTPDGAGGSTLSWDAVAVIAGEITPLHGNEQARGEGLADVTRHRIVVRWRGDISGGDRFRLGARIFAIRSVIDPAEDGRYLACICDEEGAA